MPNLIDLTGQRFGRLNVIERTAAKNGSRNAVWLCECDCGNKVAVRGTLLRIGKSRSCGCLRAEYRRYRKTISFESFCERAIEEV